MSEESNLWAKLLANVFCLALIVLISILTMIYGWGLTPKSWWWIIGCGFFAALFIRLVADKIK